MTPAARMRNRAKGEQRIKWWKLKRTAADFRERVRQALRGHEELPGDWVTTATVIEVFGVSSGQSKDDEETWWWNEDKQG